MRHQASTTSPLCRQGSTARRNGDSAAQTLDVRFVSLNYFSVLGVKPLGGRLLTPEDDRAGAPPGAVISHAIWQPYSAVMPIMVNRMACEHDAGADEVRSLLNFTTSAIRNEKSLTMLQLIAAFVLVIACAHLANLMPVRGVARRQELRVLSVLAAVRQS